MSYIRQLIAKYNLMINQYLKLTLFIVFACLSANISAQSWTEVKQSDLSDRDQDRKLFPAKHLTYKLDIADMRARLLAADKSNEGSRSATMISLPMADGTFELFAFQRADVFHPKLAARYPAIQAYTGYNVDNPLQVVKLSMSQKGMDAMIFGGSHEKIFIDRYSDGDDEHYISYYKKDYPRNILQPFTCEVVHPDDGYVPPKDLENGERYGDCTLRTYRLALACTGEYATFHGGTAESVLAEYNTSMNRVNGIYERDAAITMVLIENTDELIFFNANTDPYTNGNGGIMLDQNQTTVNQIIGSANYDIGHVYSTGGGGIASLRSPCGNRKAQGVTGQGSPVNDPFYVDYVAHEMGHQFGGNHTQNNDCNRNNSTAVEPGSAATIMGYAGICVPNVQNNSDDYFHTVNLREIADFVVAGNGGTCAVETPLTNNAPSIDSLTEDTTIPGGTPFALTAVGEDSDENDVLTYTWEQVDPEVANMPPRANNEDGPAFRSYNPVTSPTRYFPRLSNILNGTNGNTWEVLPTVDRAMNFTVTVRDNAVMGGCTDESDVQITVDGDSGPFVVNDPNLTTVWNSGSSDTVTWDVAGTDVAPVSCEMVDIYLASDEDRNFNILLAQGVPNNGMAVVAVPSIPTLRARVMVKCATSVFLDINDGDFAIIAPFSTLVDNADKSACLGDSTTYQFTHQPNNGFEGTVEYTVVGVPDGAVATFSDNGLTEATDFELLLTNLDEVAPGNYVMEVRGTAATGNSLTVLNFTRALDTNPQITNISPADGSRDLDLFAELTWDPISGNQGYKIQVSESPAFDELVADAITNISSFSPAGLSPNTVYYWRVAVLSQCYEQEFLSMQAFQTAPLTCQEYRNDANIEITEEDNNDINSILTITESGEANVIKVSMLVEHSYVGDLTANIISPVGTNISLFDRPGFPGSAFGCSRNNLDVVFSDIATNTSDDFEGTCISGEDFAIQGEYQPTSSLSLLVGEEVAGDWTLNVTDLLDPDGGVLQSWAVEVCEKGTREPGVLITNELLFLDNVSSALINSSTLQAMSGDDANTYFTITEIPNRGTVQIIDGTAGGFVDVNLGGRFTQAQMEAGAVRYSFVGDNIDTDVITLDLVDDQGRWLKDIEYNINVQITELSASAIVSSPILCAGDSTAVVTVNALGGTAPYTFSIDGENFQDTPIFEGLPMGNYTIIVRDESAGDIEITVAVTEPDAITLEASAIQDVVTVTASGGTGSLTYSANGEGFQMSNTFNLTNQTIHTITVMDGNGCLATIDVEVNYVESFTFEKTDLICFEDMTGSINVTAVVGGPEPYIYTLNNVGTQDNGLFADLVAGQYTLLVTDANDISVSQMVSIDEPEELAATADTLAGMATINVTGGTAPYSYNLGDLELQENIFNGLQNGTYTVQVRDANGCLTEVTFEILNSTVATHFLSDEEVKVYPNPAINKLYIQKSNDLNIELISIETVDGKVLKQLPFAGSIDISSLTKGVYLIRLTGEEVAGVKKIIKI